MLIVRVLRTLWALLEPRRRWVFGSLVGLMFVAGLLEMTGMVVLFGYTRGLVPDGHGARHGPVARVLRELLSSVSQFDYVLWGGALVVLVLLAKNLLSILVHFLLNRFLMKLNERVSRRLFEGYLLARYEVFTQRGAAAPQHNISRIFELFSACFGATAQVLSDGAILLMVGILLIVVDPWLTVSGVAIFGVMGVGLYWATQGLLGRMGQQEAASKSLASRNLTDGFQGLIDGRLNNTRELFVARYVSALAQHSLNRRRKLLITRLPQSMNEVLLGLVIVLAVLLTTLRGKSLVDALPTLAIFAFAGLRLTGAMSRVNKGLQTIRGKIGEFDYFDAAVKQVAPQLLYARRADVPTDQYLSDEEPLPAGVDGRLHDRLELQDVTFAYPGATKPAISELSLQIPRGSFVSFCGPSGGGKTTLVLLLMGFLKPQSGDVTCDGLSVFRHVRAWHAGIGYVGQRMYLSQGSVRENVAFGVPSREVDDAKVWQALELAAAAGFVRELPSGLDTELKEAGANLSGGQRQRLVIARALYKEPEILFFDEATAALDNVTEREITSAIARLSGTKTIICVAHRLSSIRQSDVIHLIEGGRVKASGKYDELIAESPEFQMLAQSNESEEQGPRSGNSSPPPVA
ncbi:MAG TPA: ABC transporter ATP-binding protein [Polyangiaceae bacterium]|nr:ABC transporter ATP-binding protein [Polyangiaceae bacterium]